MTELSAYETFAEKPLAFPINGKTYTLPPVGIEAGIEFAGIMSGKNKAWAKKEGVELFKLVLGPMWDQMIADGVPLDAATRVAMTAIADHQYGRDIAIIAWETGADPKALEPYLTARAAETTNRATRRSPSTAGATKTPSPARSKATTSRKK
jgi:hypothetical protein